MGSDFQSPIGQLSDEITAHYTDANSSQLKVSSHSYGQSLVGCTAELYHPITANTAMGITEHIPLTLC